MSTTAETVPVDHPPEGVIQKTSPRAWLATQLEDARAAFTQDQISWWEHYRSVKAGEYTLTEGARKRRVVWLATVNAPARFVSWATEEPGRAAFIGSMAVLIAEILNRIPVVRAVVFDPFTPGFWWSHGLVPAASWVAALVVAWAPIVATVIGSIIVGIAGLFVFWRWVKKPRHPQVTEHPPTGRVVDMSPGFGEGS